MSDQDILKLIYILSAALSPIVAIVGVCLGVVQWQINKKRLQHELFERRINLYEVITTHIANGISYGTFNNNEETQFLRDTKHTRFIFDKNIADFVDEVYSKSIDLTSLTRRQSELRGQSGPAFDQVARERQQTFDWFKSELNNIQNRFNKYLQL